jgi:hypothetical protein
MITYSIRFVIVALCLVLTPVVALGTGSIAFVMALWVWPRGVVSGAGVPTANKTSIWKAEPCSGKESYHPFRTPPPKALVPYQECVQNN